ncbi:hypothetical protein BJ508DRAFT_314094 [Ascobolus immersus RN42]|uniref:Uncharacterized protein n=1 Tax=Ascobolus immersus RN42 TaxID=1160509 RepID=A0A3N4HML7_ASCIM|nr:hypothetical protein BJ508DRAFT_314094 [Ascobolus immersus RN42]
MSDSRISRWNLKTELIYLGSRPTSTHKQGHIVCPNSVQIKLTHIEVSAELLYKNEEGGNFYQFDATFEKSPKPTAGSTTGENGGIYFFPQDKIDNLIQANDQSHAHEQKNIGWLIFPIHFIRKVKLKPDGTRNKSLSRLKALEVEKYWRIDFEVSVWFSYTTNKSSERRLNDLCWRGLPIVSQGNSTGDLVQGCKFMKALKAALPGSSGHRDLKTVGKDVKGYAVYFFKRRKIQRRDKKDARGDSSDEYASEDDWSRNQGGKRNFKFPGGTSTACADIIGLGESAAPDRNGKETPADAIARVFGLSRVAVDTAMDQGIWLALSDQRVCNFVSSRPSAKDYHIQDAGNGDSAMYSIRFVYDQNSPSVSHPRRSPFNQFYSYRIQHLSSDMKAAPMKSKIDALHAHGGNTERPTTGSDILSKFDASDLNRTTFVITLESQQAGPKKLGGFRKYTRKVNMFKRSTASFKQRLV